MKPRPESPCPCGSKKRYGNCCKPKRDREKMFLFIGVVIGGVFIAKFMFGPEPSVPPAPPGKVWSEEHGHYHDAVPGGGPAGAGQNAGTQGAPAGTVGGAAPVGTPQPPGTPPPGKVWSAEHGHWHDVTSGGAAGAQGVISPSNPGANAPAAQTGAQSVPQPGAQNIPQPAGPVPPGKVWSPEHGHWHDAPKP